jgi:predicted nucleotidyltransferase
MIIIYLEELVYSVLSTILKNKMSMNKLEPKSNVIRNLDPNLFSFEKKKEIIETLKKESNYVKDETIKTEKVEHHKKKQDIIKKLVEDGRSEEDIDTLKKILYPDSVN